MNKTKRSFWLVCTVFFLGLLVTAESLAVERILRRNEAIAEEKAYQEYRNTGCKNGRPDPLIQGEIKGAPVPDEYIPFVNYSDSWNEARNFWRRQAPRGHGYYVRYGFKEERGNTCAQYV